jgi:hypothetical protein
MKKKILLLLFVLTAIFETLSTQVVTSFVMPDSIFSGTFYPTIKDLALDKNNNIWVATIGGLAKINSNYEVVEFYKQENSGLPHFFCQALAVDTMNHLWIGTAGESLAEYDQNITWLIHNPYYDVTGIKITENNNVWFHSWNSGVAYFDGINYEWFNTQNSTIPSDDIYDIEIQNDSVIWIATINQGLARYSNNEFEIFDTLNSEISSNVIYGIEIDSNNQLYCGTDKGICMFNGEVWANFEELNSNYQINKCQPVFIDSNDFLWIVADNDLSERKFLRVKGDEVAELNLSQNQEIFRPDRVYNTPIIEINGEKYIVFSNNQSISSIIEYDFSNKVVKNSFHQTLNVFPTPTTSNVFIESNKNEISSIKILSINGIFIKEYLVNNVSSYELDLSNLNPGLYWIVVKYRNNMYEIKSVCKL